MSTTNYRLIHSLSRSQLLFSTKRSLPSLCYIVNQSHSITTTSNLNKNNHHHHSLLTSHFFHYSSNLKFSANAQLKEKSDFDQDEEIMDSDDDSDLSDFSDFSSDEDSDLEETKTKQRTFKHNENEKESDVIMPDRLIISNLNFNTNRNDLWELCENYGTVVDVHLPSNRNRDFHNRGFGFVTFETEKNAQNALDNIAGTMFQSRQLRAGFARRENERPTKIKHNQYSNRDTMDESQSQFQSHSHSQSQSQSQSHSVPAPQMNAQQIEVAKVVQELNETAITINGLPGSINLNQITKMFADFGDITNISLSPYQMMGHSFMNAIIQLKLQKKQQQQQVTPVNNERLTFQENSVQENEIKDRSIDKEEMKTMRKTHNNNNNNNNNMKRQQNQNQNQNQMTSKIDPDVLAKEIDDLLASSDEDDDDDDEEEEEEEENDDSESESDSVSSSDSDSDISDEDEEESSSDSDDEDDRIQKL